VNSSYDQIWCLTENSNFFVNIFLSSSKVKRSLFSLFCLQFGLALWIKTFQWTTPGLRKKLHLEFDPCNSFQLRLLVQITTLFFGLKSTSLPTLLLYYIQKQNGYKQRNFGVGKEKDIAI